MSGNSKPEKSSSASRDDPSTSADESPSSASASTSATSSRSVSHGPFNATTTTRRSGALRRYRPEAEALRLTRPYESKPDPPMRRLPFQPIVREVARELQADRYRESWEAYLVGQCKDTIIWASRGRANPKDVELAKRLRGDRE